MDFCKAIEILRILFCVLVLVQLVSSCWCRFVVVVVGSSCVSSQIVSKYNVFCFLSLSLSFAVFFVLWTNQQITDCVYWCVKVKTIYSEMIKNTIHNTQRLNKRNKRTNVISLSPINRQLKQKYIYKNKQNEESKQIWTHCWGIFFKWWNMWCMSIQMYSNLHTWLTNVNELYLNITPL